MTHPSPVDPEITWGSVFYRERFEKPELERLRVEVEQLRAAVEPFVTCITIVDRIKPGLPDEDNAIPGLAWKKDDTVRLLTWGDFRRLREASR